MKEISAFEFGLSLNPIGLLADLDKIRKIVQEKLFGAPGNSKSIFPDLSEVIAGSGVANVPNIQANPFRQQIAKLLDRIGRITIVANAVNFLSKAFEEKRTDLERINRLIADVKDADFDVNDRIVQIDRNLKANPNAFNKDELLAEQKILEERALALFDFLNQLEIIRDNLQKGAIAGVGIGPERIATDTPFLGFPGSSIPITLPKFDFIREFEEEFQKIEEELQKILGDGNVTLEERAQILNVLEGATAMFNGTMSDTVNPLQAHKDALEASNNVSSDLKGNTEDLADNFKDTKKKVAQAEKTVGKLDGTAVDLGVSLEKTDEVAQQLGENGLPKIEQGAKVAGDGVVKAAEEGKKGLSSLGVFAANIATQIANSFSGFISTAIKGDFDGIGDLWDNLLDSLQDSVADFAAGLIADPIRLAFEATLNGEEGNIFDRIGDLFNFGGGGGGDSDSSPDRALALGNVITAAQNPFDPAGITNALDIFNETTQASEGILSTLSSVAGTVGQVAGIVGTIVSVVLSVVNIVKGLFKKKPRLDIDLDQIRDDAGKRVGEIAKVADFLDEDLVDNIINVSVKRKAGLGGIGDSGIKKQIKDAIQTQIADIQDIINTLPADIASSLNELLLSTEVDTESLVKGDRLLEFDESKKISEKFEQFINGDLQARFLFSIRDFFVGAFESLGVLGSAAQDFIDAEFENFQGLSREERIEAGQEFLQDFQTLTDAFNVLNNNGADSIGATVNSIKNLSNSLEFDGVPSIEELDAGLEELIGEEYLLAA